MELIYQGAEAKVWRDGDRIIKERIQKKYRLPALDEKIRRERTRREANLLSTAKRAGVKTPLIFEVNSFRIIMQFIDGKKVSEILDENLGLCKEIGKNVAKLHKANIVHGDLTTSNIILKENELFFIDFGLGFFSKDEEEKGSDLVTLYHCLKSGHSKTFPKNWELFLEGYGEGFDLKEEAERIIERFKKILSRARYR